MRVENYVGSQSGSRHLLRSVEHPKLMPFEFDLNPLNHAAPRFPSTAAFYDTCRAHCHALTSEFLELRDPIMRVALNGLGRDSWLLVQVFHLPALGPGW